MSRGIGTHGARLVEGLSRETKKEPNKWTAPVRGAVRKAYSYMTTKQQRLPNNVVRNFSKAKKKNITLVQGTRRDALCTCVFGWNLIYY